MSNTRKPKGLYDILDDVLRNHFGETIVVYRNFGAEGLRSFADAVRSVGTEAISIRQGVD